MGVPTGDRIAAKMLASGPTRRLKEPGLFPLLRIEGQIRAQTNAHGAALPPMCNGKGTPGAQGDAHTRISCRYQPKSLAPADLDKGLRTRGLNFLLAHSMSP